MKSPAIRLLPASVALFVLLTVFAACDRALYPDFLVSDRVAGSGSTSEEAGVFNGDAFTENLILARTFTDGASVTTETYQVGDLTRRRFGIDFNGDGKVDPVVGYGGDQAVVQILLSRGTAGTVDPISLTLDNNRDLTKLRDVAVGDMDGDGRLDLIVGVEGAVWYFRHPPSAATTELRQWEAFKIGSSDVQITPDELAAIIAQALGFTVNLEDYNVTVEQVYTNVELGDMDGDGDHDIVASRSFRVNLDPKPDTNAQPWVIVDGNVLVFSNPGDAIDGVDWGATSIGVHERLNSLDRDGATGLLLYDLDGDGDLDVISSARDDNNVQVAWFANPAANLDPDAVWTQWRIGSIRDSWAIDVGDVTGDGLVDVVATGGEQMQVILFEQPSSGPKRSYDWNTYAIVTFASYEPRDVKILDLDNSGTPEIVLGGTEGAVRYFTSPADPRTEWNAFIVLTYDPPGTVGLLGYGDLDGDGDIDLVAVLDGDSDNDARVAWIRNDLLTGSLALP